MTTTKVYKTMIGARMAIIMGRIKSFFKGSHYVAETYTLKFEKADKAHGKKKKPKTMAEDKKIDAKIISKIKKSDKDDKKEKKDKKK